MFDTGGQRCDVKANFRKHLNLKTIRTEKILIKTFGQINDFKTQILDVAQLKIKHQFEEKYNLVEALVVLAIYSPLKTKTYLP